MDSRWEGIDSQTCYALYHLFTVYIKSNQYPIFIRYQTLSWLGKTFWSIWIFIILYL